MEVRCRVRPASCGVRGRSGVPFEHIDIAWESLKKPDFLAINPNGKVPGFADGNLNLFESLAINLYLAKKYGTGELYPTNLEDEARVPCSGRCGRLPRSNPFPLPSVLVKFGYIYSDAAGAKAAVRTRDARTESPGRLRRVSAICWFARNSGLPI